MKSIFPISLACVFGFAAACSNSDDPNPAQGAGSPIGSEGGTVTGGGASVSVPEGALGSPTNIHVAESNVDVDPPQGYTLVGPAIAFTPHGLSFALPVTLTLPYSSSASAQQLTVLHLDDEQDTSWELMQGGEFAGDSATLDVSSFSIYAVALHGGADAGSDASAGGSGGAATQSDASSSGGVTDGGVDGSSTGPDSSGGGSGGDSGPVADSGPPPMCFTSGLPPVSPANLGTCADPYVIDLTAVPLETVLSHFPPLDLGALTFGNPGASCGWNDSTDGGPATQQQVVYQVLLPAGAGYEVSVDTSGTPSPNNPTIALLGGNSCDESVICEDNRGAGECESARAVSFSGTDPFFVVGTDNDNYPHLFVYVRAIALP